MSYHTVEIGGEKSAEIGCKDGQLICRIGDAHHQLPLEDVGAILVTSFNCEIHSHLFPIAAENHIPIVFCSKFRPIGIFLPLQRSTDTLTTRAQIECPSRIREALWKRTIDAKCENQLVFAESLSLGDNLALDQLRAHSSRSPIDKEGICARLYWQLYSLGLSMPRFARRQEDDFGINSLLNYGYAVLLTHTLQSLVCSGIDPMYGMGHVVRERSTPLGFDVMEPFRPLIDAFVFQWSISCRERGDAIEVDRNFKKQIREFISSGAAGIPSLPSIMEPVVKGLRSAFVLQSVKEYEPWRWRTTKWDGSVSALICR